MFGDEFQGAGLGCLKPGQANPGLARILIVNLQLFGDRQSFCLYCLYFSFEFELSQTTQNISSKRHIYTRKLITLINF